MGITIMKLILFDLDGTLLSAGGIGRRSSKIALEKVFGTSGNLDEYYPGGRTQEAIFVDTLADAGVAGSDYLEKRSELYEIFLDSFKEYLGQGEHQIQQLPGANELISFLRENTDHILGVVTGNHQEIARLKLQTAGLNPAWFLTGAYGQESADRSDLVPLAQSRAETITEKRFPRNFTIVIGDTTRDILSAQSVEATSFALATGTDDRELLKSVKPDYIFDGLSEIQDLFVLPGEKLGGKNGI